MTEDKYITKGTLKSGRGWADRAIATLLGECDVRVMNPHYKQAAPMQLYQLKRVKRAERTAAFKKFKDAKERRSIVSSGVAEKKRDELIRETSETQVNVPKIKDYRLAACRHYNRLWEERGECDKSASLSDDKEFLDRISVNFLRHEMTRYEENLASVSGRVGCQKARYLHKIIVLDAIAGAYPELADECARQKKRAYEEESSGPAC